MSNAWKASCRENERWFIKHQKKQKQKHFGNMSIHFENYRKCFVEIAVLELKK